MTELKIYVPSSSKNGDVYGVTHGATHNYRDEVLLDYACDCRDYEFNRHPQKHETRPHKDGANSRYCKHILQVIRSGNGVCRWVETPNDPPTPDGKCPFCQRAVAVMRWGFFDQLEE